MHLFNRETWTPEYIGRVALIVAIVMLSGIVFGLSTAIAQQYYIIATAVAAVIALLVSWQFEATLCLYVLVAFIPWGETPDIAVGGSGMGKGLYVSEAMLGFLLIIWFAKYVMRTLPKPRIRTGFHIPIILYLAYCILNIIHSFVFRDPYVNREQLHFSVNAVEIGIRILSAGAFVMMATSIKNKRWLRNLTITILIPGIYNIINGFLGGPIPVSAPWYSLLSFLPAAYFCAIALDNSSSKSARIISACAIALIVYMVGFRGIAWVSGWLGILVTILTVLWLKQRRAFVVVAVLLALVALLNWSYLEKNVLSHSESEGDYLRFTMMKDALRYATTFPLGIGLGNYRAYSLYYCPRVWGTTPFSSAHGTYSQQLSELGFPGLFIFLSIPIGGFLWMRRSYSKVVSRGSKLFLLAATAQLVGITLAAFIGDYIIPTYHNGGLTTFSATVYSWLIWGLAAAHVRIDKHEQEVQALLPSADSAAEDRK